MLVSQQNPDPNLQLRDSQKSSSKKERMESNPGTREQSGSSSKNSKKAAKQLPSQVHEQYSSSPKLENSQSGNIMEDIKHYFLKQNGAQEPSPGANPLTIFKNLSIDQ